MRERVYDAACLLLSEPVTGLQGVYREPNAEIGFRGFLASLTGRALARCRPRDRVAPHQRDQRS